jgi:multisubunit Na+/H+ antiporter MnhG subunit
VVPGRDLLVADSDAEIAAAILELLTQPARRHALALAAARSVSDPDRHAARADRLDAVMDMAIAGAQRRDRRTA